MYLFIYGFCPGGAAPDGFWFSDSCVNASFWHDGCCPPGGWPPGFVQETSTEDILAWTGAASDETSMATDSAAAIAASAANVTLCVFISQHYLAHLYKKVLRDFPKLFTIIRYRIERNNQRKINNWRRVIISLHPRFYWNLYAKSEQRWDEIRKTS
jgi:hypothetical protein